MQQSSLEKEARWQVRHIKNISRNINRGNNRVNTLNHRQTLRFNNPDYTFQFRDNLDDFHFPVSKNSIRFKDLSTGTRGRFLQSQEYYKNNSKIKRDLPKGVNPNIGNKSFSQRLKSFIFNHLPKKWQTNLKNSYHDYNNNNFIQQNLYKFLHSDSINNSKFYSLNKGFDSYDPVNTQKNLDESFNDYIQSVIKKNPNISDDLRNSYSDILETNSQIKQLDDQIKDQSKAFNRSQRVGAIIQSQIDKPYAVTPHIANPKASLHANELSLLDDPSLFDSMNVPVYKGEPVSRYTIAKPGQKWTPEQMKELDVDTNYLSGTSLYETVFDISDPHYPKVKTNYLLDTPELRDIMDIPENARTVTYKDLQTPDQSILYKGGLLELKYPNKVFEDEGINPDKYIKYNPVRTIHDLSDGDTKGARYFSPSPNVAAGYAAKGSRGVKDLQDLRFIEISPEQIPNLMRLTNFKKKELRRLKAMIDQYEDQVNLRQLLNEQYEANLQASANKKSLQNILRFAKDWQDIYN